MTASLGRDERLGEGSVREKHTSTLTAHHSCFYYGKFEPQIRGFSIMTDHYRSCNKVSRTENRMIVLFPAARTH